MTRLAQRLVGAFKRRRPGPAGTFEVWQFTAESCGYSMRLQVFDNLEAAEKWIRVVNGNPEIRSKFPAFGYLTVVPRWSGSAPRRF